MNRIAATPAMASATTSHSSSRTLRRLDLGGTSPVTVDPAHSGGLPKRHCRASIPLALSCKSFAVSLRGGGGEQDAGDDCRTVRTARRRRLRDRHLPVLRLGLHHLAR